MNSTNATTTSTVTPFNFESKEVRIVTHNEEPWFVAADVCRVLEIENVTNTLKRLDDDEQALYSIKGFSRGNDQVNIISESGLYALILRSRKPQANNFLDIHARMVAGLGPELERLLSSRRTTAPESHGGFFVPAVLQGMRFASFVVAKLRGSRVYVQGASPKTRLPDLLRVFQPPEHGCLKAVRAPAISIATVGARA